MWLRRVDGHAGWANSAALRLARVDKDTKAPPGGQIIRGSAGIPTGIFIDGAMSLVGKAVPAPTREDVKRNLLAAQQICLENGLTAVHDAGISQAAADAYRELEHEGKLRVRVYAMASLPSDGRWNSWAVGRRPGSTTRGSSCGRSSFTSTERWARAGPFSLSLTTTIRITRGCT